MRQGSAENAGEIPLSWFGRTLWKFTPLYVELAFLAICLRLLGLVEPFIFQVIIDRILSCRTWEERNSQNHDPSRPILISGHSGIYTSLTDAGIIRAHR